jgi:hypothetical protein
MANVSAIHSTSTAIQRLLQQELRQVGLEPGQILIESIDRLPSPPPFPRVIIFLFNIQENAFLKNREATVTSGAPGKAEIQSPPLVIDLDYMICAWLENTADEHRVLGQILQTLYDHPELDAAQLNQDPSSPSWLADEAVQITLANMSIEDQARIWTTFGFQRFKLSLYYKARIVTIASSRTFTESTVRERVAEPTTFTPRRAGDLPPEGA